MASAAVNAGRVRWEAVEKCLCGRSVADSDGPVWGWGVCSGCGTWVNTHRPTPVSAGFVYGADYWNEVQRLTGCPSLEERFLSDLRDRIPAYLSELLPAVRQGARICEIGSGNSRMLHELAALGYDVVGTEMNPAIIERVRRLTCVPVLCGGTELFRDSEFDAVLSLDVLEHFHDPLEALREYARILKPSGVLLLHTTVHEKPEDPFRYPVAMIWKSYHLYLFSRSTLWQLISRACFEVLRAERQVFGWPVLLLRKASG